MSELDLARWQFGMNWSAYSRFVGDVFGAPLAVEALLAFFAYFILAANSWMQHPVGYRINPVTHRAEAGTGPPSGARRCPRCCGEWPSPTSSAASR